ncbi:MAG: pyridoxal phosphate-dependent aminotransferase [Gemmataceae bacterium]|nr:pyridoxal phosphate-dependent aminotransferase [Gemmataceae bacterium]
MARPFWLTKLLVRTRIAGLLPSVRRLTDGGTAALRYYSDRVLAAPVEELLDPAYLPGPPGPEVIDLNRPAPPDQEAGRPTPAGRGVPSPWGTPALRNAVADLYVRREGRAVDPDREVLVTHGATGAFAAALDAFVNPGDRLVLFDPCSPLFALGARSRRARLRWVPTWAEDGRLRYPQKLFERAMRGAKLLALADPANPSGACLSPEDLDHLLWIAAGYDVLVYLDESFARYRYDGRGRALATLPGAEKRVLTAGSVSQGWGLRAARVGWLAGPRHLVRACGLTAGLSAPYVPAACQDAAARALARPDDEFGPTLDGFRHRRGYVVDRLRGLGLEPGVPAGGYFVWVPVGGLGLDGRAFADRLLKEQGVLVGPGCAFGPSGADHVRLSFAADDGRLREGLARLARFVDGLRGPRPVAEVRSEATEVVGDEPKPVFSRV